MPRLRTQNGILYSDKVHRHLAMRVSPRRACRNTPSPQEHSELVDESITDLQGLECMQVRDLSDLAGDDELAAAEQLAQGGRPGYCGEHPDPFCRGMPAEDLRVSFQFSKAERGASRTCH